MTYKRYLHSDALHASVIVESVTPAEEGRFHVILKETIFHPQGGGQPGDVGKIGDANVLNVVLAGEVVRHITDKALPCGEWPAQVDRESRQLNTRFHSAGHLIAATGEALGWKAIKGNHRPGEGRIVFEPTEAVSAEPDVVAFSEGANERVMQALERKQRQVAGVRRVTWGDLPDCRCGGTHVVNTREVGKITILAVKFRKGQLSVTYDLAACGPSTVERRL